MNDEKWEKFFELLNEIVNAPGTHQEKAEVVTGAAATHDATDDFEEFLNWFSWYRQPGLAVPRTGERP